MNIIKKIIAVLSVSAILFSFAACKNETPAEETTTAAVTDVATEISVPSATTEAVVTEEITTEEPTTEEPTTEEPETEKETTTEAPTTTQKATTTTTKKVTTTQKVTTTKKATTTKKPTTTKKKVTAPTKKADIIKLYNSATAAASSSKPGYSKSVNTVLSNLNMGALAKIGAVRGAVGDFLGEGSASSTVNKGSFDGKSLVKSTLKESDVTAATCTLSSDGKYYELTITIKNETNPLKSSSALGRFTKDYKDVDEIKAGLADVGASVDSITVNTTKVTVKAKIEVSSNRLVSLEHNIKMNAVMNNVKYSIARVGKATAELETTAKYSNFKY